MTSSDWERVNELFLQASHLPSEEHGAYLDSACGSNAVLRADVERLLAGDAGAASRSFLEPLVDAPFVSDPMGSSQREEIEDAIVGKQIGPYSVRSLVGSGGMGRVYLGERSEPYAERVAIKLLKRGMDSDALLERFRNEIQILAELGKHPRIAALIDAGTTETGQPFLVMEYVEGERIDAFCARRDLPTTKRLELFLGVCDAVQFAHQRTVMHRDLKPTNVLVTDEGEPKLIDFGIAKVTGSDGAAQAATTQTALRVFTPNYASPEQAEGRPLTTASDVYSLGVLLYELLTGQRPYDITRQGEDAARAILAAQPRRPSVAVLDGPVDAATAGKHAPHGRQERKRAARELSGDLDNILLMALRKEPERRYATVSELADDIRRHLTQFPVVARPETATYHLGRFLSRHRVASAAAVLVSLSLSAGIFGTTWQWFRADRAARDAQLATQNAESAAERALDNERAALWQVYRANVALAGADLLQSDMTDARRRLDACPTEMRNWEWRCFDRQIRQDHVVLKGHTDAVAPRAVFSHNGARLATASRDGTLRTWDLASGGLPLVLEEGMGPISVLNCSSVGPIVAAAQDNGPIHIWDMDAQTRNAIVNEPWGSLDVGGEGALLATVSTRDNKVRLWNTSDGTLAATLPKQSDARFVDLTPDGSRLAFSSDEGVVLWDVPQNREIALLQAHRHPLAVMEFSLDSQRLVTGDKKKNRQADQPTEAELCVWDAIHGDQICETGAFPDDLWLARLNRTGDRIVSTSTGKTLRLWDGETGRLIRILAGHQNFPTSVEFSPDAKYLASSSGDQTVHLWEGGTGELLHVFAGHEDWIHCVAFSPDSRRVAAGALDGATRLWEVVAAEAGVCRGHASYVYAARWLPGDAQIVSGSWDGTVRIWDAATAQPVSELEPAGEAVFRNEGGPDFPNRVVTLDRSPDGSHIAAVVGDGRLHVWESATGAHRTFNDDPLAISRAGVVFLPKSHRIVHQKTDGDVVIREVDGDGESVICRLPPASLQALAAHPDGGDLALGLADGSVLLWQLDGPVKSATFLHEGGVNAVRYSHDGRLLATGGDDRRVRIWDVASGTQVAELPHSTKVYAVAFTPDGTRLATGSGYHAIQLWDVATWQSVAQLAGHTQYVHALDFSEDCSRLISGSGDGTVRIWDASRE